MSNQIKQDVLEVEESGTDEIISAKDKRAFEGILRAFAPHDGQHELFIPGAFIFRISHSDEARIYSMERPGICMVASGAKRITLGDESYQYGEGQFAVYSAAVPISMQVIRASECEPYLCLAIGLDPQKLAELALKVFPHGISNSQCMRAISIHKSDANLVNAAIRLMKLMENPEEAALLAPLVLEEIFIRLLRGPAGRTIAQIGIADSSAHKVARAIGWLREQYSEPMKVEDLAEIAGMSPSSFHRHFKAITTLSPLQYQKVLRLHAARSLMFSQMLDVSSASYQVGYGSISQFSREYSRYFGDPPSKDIVKLREQSPQKAV